MSIFFVTILINHYNSKSLSEGYSSTQIYRNDGIYYSKTYFLKHRSKLMLLNFNKRLSAHTISLIEQVVRHIKTDR